MNRLRCKNCLGSGYGTSAKARLHRSHAEGQGDGDGLGIVVDLALDGVGLHLIVFCLNVIARQLSAGQIADVILAAGVVHAHGAQIGVPVGDGALHGDGQLVRNLSRAAHLFHQGDGVDVLALDVGVLRQEERLGKAQPDAGVLAPGHQCHRGARNVGPVDGDVVGVPDGNGIIAVLCLGGAVGVNGDLQVLMDRVTLGSKSARDHRGDHKNGQKRRE